jgi:type II restriction enzyme
MSSAPTPQSVSPIYTAVLAEIHSASDSTGTFTAKAALLGARIDRCTIEEIKALLPQAGIIPESFDHDSTEEKLYAKFCDYLVAAAFRHLGMDAKAIVERADAADVLIKTTSFSVVADAKAFRLSRTAKNQKDFKVEALNEWRKGAHFALLVAPLFQYPSSTSQIYSQSCRYNVTLFSFDHLVCLLEAQVAGKLVAGHWEKLFNCGSASNGAKSATSYWSAINSVVAELAGSDSQSVRKCLEEVYAVIKQRAVAEMTYWAQRKDQLKGLSHQEAIEQLAKALKIDDKIRIIRQYS